MVTSGGGRCCTALLQPYCHVATPQAPQFAVTSFCPINFPERYPQNVPSYIRCVNRIFSKVVLRNDSVTNPYRPLPILTDPYQSLPILTNPYQSLPIFTNPYRSLLILTNPYQSLPILTNQSFKTAFCFRSSLF